MNKLFLALILGMLLAMPMLSALDLTIDNFKVYDTNTKTIQIWDTGQLGSDTKLIESTLLTPQINNVIYGKDRRVAEITIEDFTGDYNSLEKLISQIKFYDINKANKQIERNFIYKVMNLEDYEVNQPVYKKICEVPKNDTKEICYKEINSYEKVTKKKEVWSIIDEKTILTKKITIGIYTEVYPGDNIEWIANMGGKEIIEWATWTSSMNTNLVAYWDMNEASGVIADKIGYNNGTNVGADYGVAGILGNALTFVRANNDEVILGKNLSSLGIVSNLSVNAWVKANTMGQYTYSHIMASDTVNSWYSTLKADKMAFGLQGVSDVVSTDTVTEGSWAMVTSVFNKSGGTVNFYINGAASGSAAYTPSFTSNYYMYLGSNLGHTMDYDGLMDEVGVWNRTLSSSEVSDLYNGGTGITYIGSFPPTLIATASYPVNNYNYSLTTVPIGCNFTSTLQNITSVKLNVYNSSNYLSYTITNSGNYGTSYNVSGDWYTSALSDNKYNWSCYGFGNQGINGSTTNRTFTIDTLAPVINIVYPSMYQNFTEIPLAVNYTLTHLTAPALCWYYNGTGNTTITCGTNITTLPTNYGYASVTIYSNDSLNNIGLASVTWFTNHILTNINYTSSVIEGAAIKYFLNISANRIDSSSASLTFGNGTIYSMTNLNANVTASSYYKSIIAPEVAADTIYRSNITYFVGGVEFNIYNINTTIYNVPTPNVSSSCPNPALTFQLKDEENLTNILGDFDYNFYYGTAANPYAVNIYGTLSGINNMSVCINTTIATTWTLGRGEISYRAAGFVDRKYYTFTNITLRVPSTNITLAELLTTEQTSFKLQVEDTSLNPYVNKFITLVRWYPNLNEYKVVDMGKTDDLGSTVIHVKTEDVDYRIGVYEQNGTLIRLAEPIRMICQVTPCVYTLRIDPITYDYSSFLKIQYTFNFNYTTNMWTFSFSDPSAKTSTMNMTVYVDNPTLSYEICSTSVTGSSGAMSCNTTGYTGTLRAQVYRSASPPILFAQKVINIVVTAFKSSFGLFLSLLIAIPLMFVLALISPVAAIIGGVIAMLPAYYFGSINIGIMGAIIIMGGIIAHFLRRIR